MKKYKPMSRPDVKKHHNKLKYPQANDTQKTRKEAEKYEDFRNIIKINRTQKHVSI